MSFADYPIYKDLNFEAHKVAREESKEHPDHFIYGFRNSQGSIRIDHTGIRKADDERNIFTYINGHKTL